MGGNAGPMAEESRPAKFIFKLPRHVGLPLLSFSRSLAVSALAGTAGTAGRARAWSVSVVHAAVIIFVVVVFVAACRRLSELNTAVFYLFGEIRFIVLGHI